MQETEAREEAEAFSLERKRFKMPRGDRSGPDGRGPRGGVCVGAGLGRGFGNGRGRGIGRGVGLGFGRGFAGVYPVSQISEQEVLENRAAELERELALLKSRLNQSADKPEN